MAGHDQAPKLLHKGAKQRSENYWSYDPDVLEFIGNETGKAYSQFKLMLYLMGNSPEKWHCSEKNILKRTGISDPGSLSKVKKKLKERGWIDYKEGEYIMVLFDNIYEQMREGCSENKSDIKTKSEGCSQNLQGCSQNKSQGCSENNAEGCSQNNHNNISNNINNNKKDNRKDSSPGEGIEARVEESTDLHSGNHLPLVEQQEKGGEEKLAEVASNQAEVLQGAERPSAVLKGAADRKDGDLPLFHLVFQGAVLQDLIDMGIARQIEENTYEITTKDGKKTLVREK